jgi:hypothetical protein
VLLAVAFMTRVDRLSRKAAAEEQID